ncbi:phage portal protein [Stakelama sp. CBK3Z-3]|uniref:Phage portal protein n=1 Tax=Stakelama flava TaxID=2860338 RepID=A0ABS6XK61_9SPHN|nr:phage portal protein [Stakelama flava]MBW4330587.1 phage portal protein [Stakelama flava]
MGWFGRKTAGRDDARPVLSRVGASVPVIGEWPRSYEAQVREAYLGNAVAQRAVRLVAEGVGSAPVAASSPELAALVASHSGGQGLLETLASHLLLHGNGYIQLIADGSGGVGELFALRPERVTVEPDAQGWPVAYRYRVGERVTRLAVEEEGGRPQIAHVRSFNPVDDHYGLGCLGAAAGAVAIHNAAAKWNKALLDNAARPSGALVYEPGDGASLSGDQFERLRTEMEAAFAGAANAGRPMLLEGGLKWQAMSLSPADMDFVGLKAAAAREIALAFGVPPMLLGLPGDNTYANYREANRALWRQAILPLAGKILGALEQALGAWATGATLSVDLDRVPALAEDRERLWAQVSGAEFLSDAEKRAMLGV